MDKIPVKIVVKADQEVGPWRQIYRFFGCDEINYTYMKDGKKLLTKLGNLASATDQPSLLVKRDQAQESQQPNPDHQVYFRVHNQFCTGNGIHALKWGSTNAYTETPDGTPVYDWTIIDKVYDSYLATGLKPYAQFGFMPQALSTKPTPYQHAWTPTAPYHDIFTGWSYPPNDYGKWQDLCYEWTKHCVERYGRQECESWWWETWNEPDIGYWNGTPAEFNMLHDYTVAGIRKALPSARVGGPETTGGGAEYLRGFLEHCSGGINAATGERGTPLDFVSFHAKGRPMFIADPGYVRMGIAQQLREIDASLAVVASFPEYQGKPIVIGESDPEGAAAAQGPELLYRNGTLYSSYTAASFARKHLLANKHGSNLAGALTWAFEFEGQPFFAGFRVLASNDVDLPVLNVFRMFARMGGKRVMAESSNQVSLEAMLEDGVREEPDVGVIACEDGGRTYAMIWHYHDDDVEGPVASIELEVHGTNAQQVTHLRVDEEHSNSYSAWQAMGSPQQPTKSQYESLKQAGELAVYTGKTRVAAGDAGLVMSFELPRQGVSLLILE